jgi:cysteine desulfurase family protein
LLFAERTSSTRDVHAYDSITSLPMRAIQLTKPMRIYLDNAATSWPKPDAVYDAVDQFQRRVGVSAGRGGFGDALESIRMVDAARRDGAALIGAADPRRIIFGHNGSDALNLAIHGTLRPGDHVVASVCDHNTVLRPLAEQTRTHGVAVNCVRCSDQGFLDPDDMRRAMKPRTRLVVVNHASNVTGAIQPLAEIAAAVRDRGALLLVDASQSAGHAEINVEAWGVDLLAASGHKGLLGPTGTGILYVREGVESELRPTRQGGTGVESILDRQPDELPTRYEAGSLNGAGIAGLGAAASFLRSRTIAAVAAHEAALVARLWSALAAIDAIALYGPPPPSTRGPVVSFSVRGYDPQEFAAALDASFGVQCRAGLHCAPKMHEALGTLATGGLVRLSVGWSTTEQEVDQALEAIAVLAAA